MSNDPIIAVIGKVRETLQNALKEIDALEKHYQEQPAEVKLDSAKLDSLPWKPYSSGTGAWIFADTKGAEELWAALRQRPTYGRIELEGWTYRLSHGENRDFISRNKTMEGQGK